MVFALILALSLGLTLARAEHRPHQGKNAGGLDQEPARAVRQVPPVQFGQPRLEIIAHQRDGQVGGAPHDANAQRFQRGAELLGALHVDQLDAHTTVLQIGISVRRRHPEARPIGVGAARRRARRRNDEAAVGKPLQCFADLVGGKVLFQRADDLGHALAGADGGGERTVERAMEKELPVLGIEAHDIGRQHIDGEIRREPRNGLAVALRRAVSAFACPEASTRASTLTATSLDRHCKARILHWSGRRRRARALVRWI